MCRCATNNCPSLPDPRLGGRSRIRTLRAIILRPFSLLHEIAIHLKLPLTSLFEPIVILRREATTISEIAIFEKRPKLQRCSAKIGIGTPFDDDSDTFSTYDLLTVTRVRGDNHRQTRRPVFANLGWRASVIAETLRSKMQSRLLTCQLNGHRSIRN